MEQTEKKMKTGAMQTELPIPETAAPEITEYESDILVVGTGYAGITAAVTAKKAGAKVVLVDKGGCAFSALHWLFAC